MVTIQIGLNGERKLEEVDKHWIIQQINRRRDEQQSVCVRIAIQNESVHMTLTTLGCPQGGGGGGRTPNKGEQHIFDLWHRHKLDQLDFSVGQLIAFLGEIEKLF